LSENKSSIEEIKTLFKYAAGNYAISAALFMGAIYNVADDDLVSASIALTACALSMLNGTDRFKQATEKLDKSFSKISSSKPSLSPN
jgi:hypothetical protein